MFNILLFYENHAVYEIMRKDVVESENPQMTIKYRACAFHAGTLKRT
jgi:hypothetical protein